MIENERPWHAEITWQDHRQCDHRLSGDFSDHDHVRTFIAASIEVLAELEDTINGDQATDTDRIRSLWHWRIMWRHGQYQHTALQWEANASDLWRASQAGIEYLISVRTIMMLLDLRWSDSLGEGSFDDLLAEYDRRDAVREMRLREIAQRVAREVLEEQT